MSNLSFKKMVSVILSTCLIWGSALEVYAAEEVILTGQEEILTGSENELQEELIVQEGQSSDPAGQTSDPAGQVSGGQRAVQIEADGGEVQSESVHIADGEQSGIGTINASETTDNAKTGLTASDTDADEGLEADTAVLNIEKETEPPAPGSAEPDRAEVKSTAADSAASENLVPVPVLTDEAALDDSMEEIFEEEEEELLLAPDIDEGIELELPAETAEEIVVPEGTGDNDELFGKYLEENIFGQQKGRKLLKAASGLRLQGAERVIYLKLKEYISKVAAGEQWDPSTESSVISTEFTIPVEEMGFDTISWTAEELGVDAIVENGAITAEARQAADRKVAFDFRKILTALLSDCPYELFWYAKEVGATYPRRLGVSAPYIDGEYILRLKGEGTFAFAVDPGYGDPESYTVYPEAVQTAKTAAANAQLIVDEYAGLSDLDKLTAYKNAICSLTSYNRQAANSSADTGDPWQLTWVFDNLPETAVVCEGYAKAFQYLFDLSAFANPIECRIVTGTMNGGTGAGGHMWNIVQMNDGCNYLVDITNCDEGTIGYSSQLFLAGTAEGSVESGYSFSCNGRSIVYVYDSYTAAYFAESELELATASFMHPEHTYAEWTVVKAPTCTAAGTRRKVCTGCGNTVTETIEATGHTWDTEYTVDKESTCTQEGEMSYHCSVCDAVKEGSSEPIQKKDHTYGAWTVTEEPTCTETGTRKKVCTVCGDTVEEPIEAAGHTWDTEYTVDRESTCTQEGEMSIHCSVCDAVQEGSSQVIQKKEHNYVKWTVDRESTCTQEGEMSIHCSVCDAVQEGSSQVIPKKEHTYGEWTVTEEPTCTETGTRKKICTECGDTVEEPIEAAGHSWNTEYTIDRAATYSEEGSESIHCAVCGEIQEGSERILARVPKPVSMTSIEGIVTKTYSGSTLEQAVIIRDQGKVLVHGVDYTTAYKNNINAGTGTVVITGTGNYTGSKTVTFTITPMSVSGASVTGVSDTYYTGLAKKPVPTVKIGSKTLKNNSDYTLSYKNNTNVGTAAVIITGKGNYTGTLSKNFSILPVAVTGISLNKTGLTITAGKTAALTASVSPSDATNKKVTWTSSNTVVATVNASGVVTAKKAGTVNITAKSADGSGKTAVCTVTVKPAVIAVTGVKLNKSAIMMGNGQSVTLTASVSPSNATNKKVIWKSSNTKIASVSSNGKVTSSASANGTVKITASTADGKKIASCTVTVKKPSVSYRTHVQTYGWQNYVRDGAMSGTSGKAKRLEGINIGLSNLPYSGNIVYRTHVQTYGWQGWKKNGAMSGTSGQAKRLEGIQIYLTGELAKHYDIYYCVHAQTYGWLGWSKNGVMAGTSGLAKRLEGIRILLVPKGSKAPSPVGSRNIGYVCGNGTKLPANPSKGS